MPKFSLFSTPKHQRFQYKPMYWDPKKEKTEALKARIAQIQNKDVEGTKARISSGLKTGYGGNPQLRSKLVRQSNIRILGIIGMLVLLSFLLIATYLDTFIAWLAK